MARLRGHIVVVDLLLPETVSLPDFERELLADLQETYPKADVKLSVTPTRFTTEEA